MEKIYNLVSTEPFFFTVLLIGMFIGAIIQAVVSMLHRPYANRLMSKERSKMKDALQDYRQTNLNLVEENIFWRSELEKLRQLHFSQSKTNRELGDTIIKLSEEKATLQNCNSELAAKFGAKYVECDIAKARLSKYDSPVYRSLVNNRKN